MEKLINHLQEDLTASSLPDVFWLPVPKELLSDEQASHSECLPHRVAVVLDYDSMKVEMLVRSATSLRCSCTGYVSEAQRAWLISWVDQLIAELELST